MNVDSPLESIKSDIAIEFENSSELSSRDLHVEI